MCRESYLVELIYSVAKLCTGVYRDYVDILGCLYFLFQLTTHHKNNRGRKNMLQKNYSIKSMYAMLRQTSQKLIYQFALIFEDIQTY